MTKALTIAAAAEAATGLALVVVPSLVGQLLLDEKLTGVAIPVARVAGIALIALGLACWPGTEKGSKPVRALRAMLCYSLLVTLYLAYLGIRNEWVGNLLWPAVAVHAVLTLSLSLSAWKSEKETGGR